MSVLTIESLAVSYGSVEALRGVSLTVEEFETIAVLGANGAGKSTLLRTISGLNRLNGGSVRFCDQEIGKLPPNRIAALRLAHVPEGRRVFGELTVEENLMAGAYRLRRDRVRIRALMTDVYELFPRLAERRRQLSSSLSGGEQQMLALGRALMGEPKLLMLDEPSLGLAPIIVARVFEAIRHMQTRGLTILLVEQNASLALKHCSRAYVLSLGQIVAEGTGARLLEDPSVKAAYLGASAAPPDERGEPGVNPESGPALVRRFRTVPR